MTSTKALPTSNPAYHSSSSTSRHGAFIICSQYFFCYLNFSPQKKTKHLIWCAFYGRLKCSVVGPLLNRIQDRPFQYCSKMRGKEVPPSPKSVTHMLQLWNMAIILYLRKIQKIYDSRNISIFHQKFKNIVLSRNRHKDCILIRNF